MKSEIIAVVSVGVVSTGIVVGVIGAIWSDVSSDIGDVRAEIVAMRSDVGDNSERLARVEGKLEDQGRQLAEIKNTIGAHESRFDAIEQTLVSHGSALNNIVRVIALAGWGDEGVTIIEQTADEPAPDYDVMAQVAGSEDAAIIIAEVPVIEPEAPAPIDVAEATIIEPEVPEAFAVAEVIEDEPSYMVITEKDSSFGNVRRRVTLEIRIAGADPTSSMTIQTMMLAATNRYNLDRPDAVSVRLWDSYGDDSSALNSIVFAPDGCGWPGDDCTGELWTELLKGDMPNG